MDTAFDHAQARYDAATPPVDELDPAETVAFILEDLLDILGKTDGIEDGGPVGGSAVHPGEGMYDH